MTWGICSSLEQHAQADQSDGVLEQFWNSRLDPTLQSTRDMEVTLSADLQARLTRIARDRGTDAQALAREAIERLVDYDDWFVRARKGPGADRKR